MLPPAHTYPELQEGGSTGGGVVMLQDGAAVPYDWLVVSLGAETSTFGIPGVKDCALPFSTFQDAERVRRRQAGWLAGRLGLWQGAGCRAAWLPA